MGRKGVSKRKPKKDRSFSNTDTSGASSARSGEHSVVASLVKDHGVPLNIGGTNPSVGSNKKHRKGS